MKLWTKWVVAGLALALAFSLGAGSAAAQTSKKKKKKKAAVVVIEKKVVKKEEHRKHFIEGTNVNGRPGLFFSDTASTPAQGQIMAAVSPAFYSAGSAFSLPFGAAYGLTKEIQVHVSTAFEAEGGGSGLGYLVFGGKYGFHIDTPGLQIAGGLDLAVGPLTNSPYSSFGFDPYGVVTYSFKDGFALNGQIGIFIPTGSSVSEPNPLYGYLPGEPATVSYNLTPPAAFQFNAGCAYPFDPELTGIGELACNPGTTGEGNTLLLVGIRTGREDIRLQAYGGLQLAGLTGVVIGGSVMLLSH